MARPLEGDRALTPAERQARRRAQLNRYRATLQAISKSQTLLEAHMLAVMALIKTPTAPR